MFGVGFPLFNNLASLFDSIRLDPFCKEMLGEKMIVYALVNEAETYNYGFR